MSILHHQLYGEGPPLIILHGLFGSSDNWRSIAKILSHQFSVYVLDLRNHGQSFHDPDHSYKALAKDVTTFMDYHVIPNAYMLGHSMGGKVVMQLMVTESLRIKKACIVDITPFAYPPKHKEIVTALKEVKEACPNSRVLAKKVLELYLSDDSLIAFLLKNYKKTDGGWILQLNIHAIETHLSTIFSAIPLIAPIYVDTLFIKGGLSDYIKETDIPAIEALFAKVNCKLFHNAGHWVHASCPQDLISCVSDYFKP